MSSDPQCVRCGARGFGNCPMTPPCTGPTYERTCAKCGVSDYDGNLCPEAPYIQSNIGGHGWRQVPNRIRDCIDREEAADRLGKSIREAMARHHAPEPQSELDFLEREQ